MSKRRRARKRVKEAWRRIRRPMPPPTRVEVDERQKALERLARHEADEYREGWHD